MAGQGHAHIFIDNEKVGRAYSPWFYAGPQSRGKHSIKVTLNPNDHRLFLVNAQPVEAVLEFTPAQSKGPHAHH